MQNISVCFFAMTQLIQKVLQSKVFGTREKWVIVRYLKNPATPEAEVQKIAEVFEHEDEYVRKSAAEYAVSLADWNQEMEEIIHEELPKKRQQAEERDEEDPEDILRDL